MPTSPTSAATYSRSAAPETASASRPSAASIRPSGATAAAIASASPIGDEAKPPTSTLPCYVRAPSTFSNYLGVMNDVGRQEREQCSTVGQAAAPARFHPYGVQCGIELKLAAVRQSMAVSGFEVERFENSLLAACCKLAKECVDHAYVIGLSHGPQPDAMRAYTIIGACMQLYASRRCRGPIYFALATPTHTVLAGDWSEEIEFPNVVFAGGYPAGQGEATGQKEAVGPGEVQKEVTGPGEVQNEAAGPGEVTGQKEPH